METERLGQSAADKVSVVQSRRVSGRRRSSVPQQAEKSARMRPSSAGAISCLSICSSLGLHAGQVAQVLFSEIAGDDSVDLAHGIADTGEGGGVRLKDRLPDGAGQIELAALIGKIIPQAGGEITGIEKAAAEGPLCLAGGQTQRLVAGLDGLCAGRIVGDKPQIVQRQAGLSREQCREGAQLLGIGLMLC